MGYLALIEDAWRRWDTRVLSSCLMGTHYRLVLQIPVGNLQLLNPTSKKLKDAPSNMTVRLEGEKNRALLFCIAGRGETLELADGSQLGYMIPSDCPVKREDSIGFDNRAISMKEVEALALKVKSKHFLMMFDSCFSESLFDLVRATPRDITEKPTRSPRQFIAAGSAGEQVPDQSVFKVDFVDGIEGDADLKNDGYVTGSELGMRLQDKVVNYSSGGEHRRGREKAKYYNPGRRITNTLGKNQGRETIQYYHSIAQT